jgi:hypothetical protein
MSGAGRVQQGEGRITYSNPNRPRDDQTHGLPWHYEQYAPNETEYSRLERLAQNANGGLWSQPSPIAPWEWRDRGSREPEKDRDCSDFDTQPEAQRFFEAHQPGEPHNLDGNGDREACESLPGE